MDIKQRQDQRHADIDAVLDLFKISGPGILVDLYRDLVDAGQGVQHIHVVLGAFHQPFVENIEILESDVVLFIEETLSLHACHVEKIKLCDDVFQFDALFIGITALLKKVCDVVSSGGEMKTK